MSISLEQAEKHKNDIAVVCCRTEAGTVIAPENLEDPAILPDLEDSGLLKVPENVLKVGEVLGATLKETIDSLTALTPDVLDGVKAIEEEKEEVIEEKEEVIEEAIIETPTQISLNNQPIKIEIEEGEGIKIEIVF